MNDLLLSSQNIKETTCIHFIPPKKMIDSMNLSMYDKESDEDNGEEINIYFRI